MIKVNGLDFKDFDEAILHLQDLKEKEASEQLNKERNRLLNKLFKAVLIHDNHEDKFTFVCCITEDEDSAHYPAALAENYFGERWNFHKNTFVANYDILSLSVTNPSLLELKEFLKKNLNESLYTQKWRDVKIESLSADCDIILLNMIQYKEHEERYDKASQIICDLLNGLIY